MKLEHSRRGLKVWIIIFAILVVIATIFLVLVATRDLPEVDAKISYEYEEKELILTGLGVGQAAIGSSTEIKAIYGGDEIAPIASMAKLITSIVAMEYESDLEKIITFDEQDVEFYRQAVMTGGSRLQVVVGEQLSLRQMQEALLIVSANNIADSLVYHLFGNQENYKIIAEKWLKEHDLNNTIIGLDASGLDPGTMSSPSDMISIGQIVLQNPELSQIVRKTYTSFPLEGKVENTNKLLGEGYYGIKTGNTLEAGSCLLFVTQSEGNEIIGVLMGQPFNSTFDLAKMLVEQAKENFTFVSIPAGTVVGKYDLPWEESSDVVTSQDISAMTWGDLEIEIEIKPYKQSFYGDYVGSLKLAGKEISLNIRSEVPEASLLWRITNFNQLKW